MTKLYVFSLDNLLLNDLTLSCESNKSKLYTRTIFTGKNNNIYSIYQYDKNFLSLDLISTIGLLRSIIVNKYGHVVCFAPPKSYPYDSFIQKYPESGPGSRPGPGLGDEIVAEEFVEGVMINVFWDETSGLTGAWEIATRSAIGGETLLAKSASDSIICKTIRDMFLEAAKRNQLDIASLNPVCCYSFVLQHPDDRNIQPFKTPQLYLVETYEIVHTKENHVKIFPIENNVSISTIWCATTVKFPKMYHFKNYQELKDRFGSMNTSYHIPGIMIKNTETGERCKIRNPVYEYVKHIKGNQLKIQYQYLTLRKEGMGKVGEFLSRYPENKKECSYFRDQLHAFTITLYKNYISCYIKKEKLLKLFPGCFKRHIQELHKLYVNVLKPKNEYINNTSVIQYVNALDPHLLMNSLNVCIQQRHIDMIKKGFQ